MGTSQLEREIKLRFQSPAEAREAVIGIGATPLRGRRLQEDCLLDTDDERLRAARSVLRVRMDQGRSLLTYKGPVQPAPWKLREERETVVSDGETSSTSSGGWASRSGFATRSTARSSAPPTPSSRSTRRPSARSSRSKAARRRSPTRRCARPLRTRLHRGFVPGPVRAALRGQRFGRRRHDLRRVGSRNPLHVSCPAPNGGSRNPAEAAVGVRAKPALPVAGEALVRRVLGWLAASGVIDVVLNLHHRPETVCAVVGDGSDLGIRARYSWENPVLGSAGGPRRALPLLEADRFFIVNGDTLTDLDPAVLAAAHARVGRAGDDGRRAEPRAGSLRRRRDGGRRRGDADSSAEGTRGLPGISSACRWPSVKRSPASRTTSPPSRSGWCTRR